MTFRTTLSTRAICGVCAAALLTPIAADAQTMREPKASSIEVVVGSQAGATPDIFMRKLAKALADEKLVTLPMVVTPRPGGAWTTASNYVVGKKGEENVLFSIVPTVFTTPITQGRPNVFDQLTPLAMLMRIELLVRCAPTVRGKR